MKIPLIFLFIITFFSIHSYTQSHKILESTREHLKIEFNFEKDYKVLENSIDGRKYNVIEGKELHIRNSGEPWLPNYLLNFGVPYDAEIKISVITTSQENIQGVFILPAPDSLDQPYDLLPYQMDIYNTNGYFPLNSAELHGEAIMRYVRIASISIAPYQFNPVSRDLIFNKKIVLLIEFKKDPQKSIYVDQISDKMTDDMLRASVVNFDIAKEFVGRIETTTQKLMINDYWYNPQKDYYKFYLNEKGVYRITYEMLINSGISPSAIQDMNFEIFNDGISIPIDIVDNNNDGIFNSGDYFQFVGGPATPADQWTRMNIYNLTNVYWFSFQADSVNNYRNKNGHPTNFFPLITSTVKTLRFEQDVTYHQFGHALNDNRDYWYWSSTEARNRQPVNFFEYWLQDSIWANFNQQMPQVNLKIGMHGLTSTSCTAQNGHDIRVIWNGKTIGTHNWNGQTASVFDKNLFLSFGSVQGDTALLNWQNFQQLIVQATGNICDTVQSDFVLINNIEFSYWRWNSIWSNNFIFKSPPNNFNENTYYLFRWLGDNMKIFIPSRGEIIENPLVTNDADQSVYFTDTVSVETEYFCVADDYFLLPDSIIRNVPSDLRSTSNGADYIIITHPDFLPAAQTLAEFRSSYLPGFPSPRVKIVVVDEIYNEFSYGLLNPVALQRFAKYAFEQWQSPAPDYIVLMGDMSHDYRSIKPNSRKNFIPSMPFHAHQFGQLPSDNLIVAVVGNDISPDIALGRLTSETLEEANVLVNKILTYPIDKTKEWKENVILLASGLSYQDQIQFGFNSASKLLENSYLTPNGIRATKVFNYPEPPDIEFLGGGPKMRQEIDKGAALVNYYGHGGGSQWDLIFTKDDLPLLDNAGRLPVVLSITCYTANFDNSESFGEVFTKIPNKGAIGFWGSVGLTYWQAGKTLNQSLFSQVFNNRNYVIGSAIMAAKSGFIGGTFDQMLAQLSYLGDPAIELNLPTTPDFAIRSSDITISPTNPLKEDTISVTINIRNWGVTFPGDSVIVEVFKNNTDPSNLLHESKIGSFGFTASVGFDWIAEEAGLYNLIARVNEKDAIEEIDHSDNTASNSFSVFDFGQPNIIKPVNGYFNNSNQIDFIFSDIGFYFDRNFNYIIQINDSPDFSQPPQLMVSPVLSPVDAVVKWKSNPLPEGEYYWRAIIYDPVDTNFSPIRIFTITNINGSGYLAQKSHMKLFDLINIDYDDQLGSLVLNTEIKPPHPDERFYLETISFEIPDDSTQPATFTTDGDYFYYGELPFRMDSSKIYKIGTGLNGTIAGQNYGSIPNVSININSQIFHKDGYIFANTREPNSLLRINPVNGDTSTVILTDSLLLTQSSGTQWGGYYFYYDGVYLHNLAVGTTDLPNKFVLRTFNPNDNWKKIGDDIIFSGNTIPMVMSFIVAHGYLIVYENLNTSTLRRYRLSDGIYEEEWIYAYPIKDYYTMTYDYQNNFVYFSSFRPVWGTYQPGFSRYSGSYIEANGSITSQEIGPASKWHNLEYDIDQTNSNGLYRAYLSGKSKDSGQWEVLDTLNQELTSIESIDVNEFNYLKLNVEFVDSSLGSGQPMKFNSLKINYDYLPEISMIPKDMTFHPDSMLQGIDINMNLKVHNLGYIPVDSLKLDFFMNEGDSVFLTRYISVQPDSFTVIDQVIGTSKIVFDTKIKALASTSFEEYFTYNNLIENSFFVARDTIKPTFSITFDGQEIIDGDIISSQPEIVITLEDNSPLPITPNLFTLVHQNVPLKFENNPDLSFTYSPGETVSRAVIVWTPTLVDGRHTLEVLAKDSSGNFFDSTSHRSIFYVYSDADIRHVYNYPNPFSDDTYFTFELRGTLVPDELRIKIFTVAGRLIREFSVPPNEMQIGFNRHYWDGRDQDGDEIANGLYFYKVIAKHEGEIKTITQKLAKVK